MYIIALDGKNLFWNNELGWTDRQHATVFTWKERYEDNLDLPIGGVWWVIA